MAERFKSLRGDVRLASIQGGHVVIVGQEFAEVPDCLVSEAMANRCIPESMYNELKAQVAAESGGITPVIDPPVDPPDIPAIVVPVVDPPVLTPIDLPPVAPPIPPEAPVPIPPDPIGAAADRRAQIIAALQALASLKEAGTLTTAKGETLEYQGKPRVDAVSELAGFRVKAAEIEEALQ
jgi:hypothetical protein